MNSLEGVIEVAHFFKTTWRMIYFLLLLSDSVRTNCGGPHS